MQHERPAARPERRGDAGEMQPGAPLHQCVPWRILETELRGCRMLTIVDHAAGPRLRSGLIKHQPQPRPVDPAYPARIDPVATRLTIDHSAERPSGQTRDPSNPAAEPSEQASDVELAATDPDFQKPRLLDPLQAGRGQPQQGFAEG